jgi:RecA/RadA recombinase
MISSRQLQLDRAVAALHQRWGPQSLTPLAQLARPANGIATGFAALDNLLGPAAIPLGALTELFGQPTSGTTTFAYHLIGQAQAGGRYAVYLDLDGTFDPEAAQRAGIALDRVLLAQPESDVRALDGLLDRLALSRPVTALTVEIGRFAALMPRQMTLFGDDALRPSPQQVIAAGGRWDDLPFYTVAIGQLSAPIPEMRYRLDVVEAA